ncbi:DUF1642 domain-containing protein [uncultured Pediococcus sp.]|uniref:DUF1642 domain-containing protein n=1 Tax=uncultured Pediococcus sp. TaxID=165192 RepID=UPI00259BEE98|nr:DUF1642 domain-containing protein [uncultured Pediococcus sp.]
MTKEEYTKTLEEYVAGKVVVDAIQDDYYDGYFGGLERAIVLAEKLDEPKKVVIPEYIANDIKYHKKHGSTLRGTLGSTFDQGLESDVYCWFFANDGDENVRKYISAWDNGYEIEKEPEYRVRVKGISTNQKNLLRYHISLKTFELAGVSTNAKNFKTEFTKQWLKDNWAGFNTYNNAGLLDFEEVKD